LPEEKKPITIKVNKSIPSKKELLQESWWRRKWETP
jgi:hypothetical protein